MHCRQWLQATAVQMARVALPSMVQVGHTAGHNMVQVPGHNMVPVPVGPIREYRSRTADVS